MGIHRVVQAVFDLVYNYNLVHSTVALVCSQGLCFSTGFTPTEAFRKYLWYVLLVRKFDHEAVNDLLALKVGPAMPAIQLETWWGVNKSLNLVEGVMEALREPGASAAGGALGCCGGLC